MGYSTKRIEVSYATVLTAGKDVVEASSLKYFEDKKWVKDIESAELGDNNMVIIKTEEGNRIRAEDVEFYEEGINTLGCKIGWYKFYNCILQKEDKIRFIDVKDIQLINNL